MKARHAWLAAHPRAAVRKTVYRTRCLIQQIQLENWQLALRPVRAGGVEVG